MYWLTEPKESFLNEACGDWKNCYIDKKTGQKPTKKKKGKKKQGAWIVKRSHYKIIRGQFWN